MVRKLILSAVIAAGSFAGLATTASSADAHAPAFHHRFKVFVQCGHGWEPRGMFPNRAEAQHFARHLRHEGFRVEIRPC
jgi:hypothetical protein